MVKMLMILFNEYYTQILDYLGILIDAPMPNLKKIVKEIFIYSSSLLLLFYLQFMMYILSKVKVTP